MAYVPPHRRHGGPRTPLVPPDTRPSGREQLNKRPPNAPVPETKEEYTTEEIQNHYWDLRRAGMTGEEQPTPRYSTLNDAKHKEGALTHVMMFHRAQQRWDDESVILAKFNLHILPGYYQCKAQRAAEKVTGNWNNAPSLKASTTSSSVPLVGGIHQSSDERVDEKVSDEIKGKLEDERNEITSETNENVGETDSGDDANTQRKSPLINEIPELEIIPTNTTPVAFFAQWPGPMESEDFRFCGYYHVKYIALLAPYSQALARMLEQKRNLFNGWDKALTMQHPERMKGIGEHVLDLEHDIMLIYQIANGQ